jgi:ribosomal protein S27E
VQLRSQLGSSSICVPALVTQLTQHLRTKTKDVHGRSIVDRERTDMSDDDNVIWFIEKLQKRYVEGRMSHEKFTRYEMMELDFNPNSEEDRKEYELMLASMMEMEVELEESIIHIQCEDCGTEHKLWHMEWELLICPECNHIIQNPEKQLE